MIVMAWRTDGNQRYNWMKNRRSLLVNWTRPRTWRCSTMSCCLSAAFSASSRLLGLNNDAPRLKRKNISATIAADVKRFCHQIKNGQGFRYTQDRVLVFGKAHLRKILSSYAAYYNEVRTHLALGKDGPVGRAVQRTGVIVAIPILSGLHHQYVRPYKAIQQELALQDHETLLEAL